MYLVFPQWQGAGNLPELADAARRLGELTAEYEWTTLRIDASPLVMKWSVKTTSPRASTPTVN